MPCAFRMSDPNLCTLLCATGCNQVEGLCKLKQNRLFIPSSPTHLAPTCAGLALETFVFILSGLFDAQDLIDWASVDPLLQHIVDARRVYLLGHSRGGKIAALTACQDSRVTALCLIDPVDNTVYAPLGPGYPSAIDALRDLPPGRSLPVAVVGAPPVDLEFAPVVCCPPSLPIAAIPGTVCGP
jgi:pimeloyl-ACP methyl ester carboxylesterase